MTDTADPFRAWEDFCAELTRLGRWVQEQAEIGDNLDRAEGIRYLSRLVRGGLESHMERSSVTHPHLGKLPYNVKLGVDNPDAVYQSASIDGQYRYRIWGNRGTVHYLSIIAYSGDFGTGADRLGSQGRLVGHDLVTDDDGNFEAILAVDEPDGAQNWLQLEPEGAVLVVRNFHLDRRSEQPATIDIECLDEVGPPGPLTALDVAAALSGTIDFIDGTMRRFMDQILEWREHRPNTLDFNNAPRGGMGDSLQKFRHGYFQLRDDEALVIRATPPPCFYWNAQVDNLWMESLDYRHHNITVNKHTAAYESDGSVIIVISHTDPGVGNWLTTAGHRHGGIGLRWNQPEYDVVPDVTVMSLDQARVLG